MDSNKKLHLEFIQNIITRLNTNSFQIKGMCITIVSALLAIYASNYNLCLVLIAIIPTILFWGLDAYYLQQERKFRALYNDVVEDNVGEFNMSLVKYTKGKFCFFKVFSSKTISIFYLSILIILVVLIGIFLILNK